MSKPIEASIVVVDDEPSIRELLVASLHFAGFEVNTAASGSEAIEVIERLQPDLIVLDVMLPDIDGFTVSRRIRQEGITTPVLYLTARDDTQDKVMGLTVGGDDYVTKPFSVLELTARVDALVRRLGLHSFTTETIQSGEFCLDMRARELKKNGKRVDLTQVEFSLMKTFLENRGRAMDREELLGAVWGKHYSGELKIVDVNIRRLRIKVEDDPASPRHITTVRGFGYMWKD